MIEAMTCFHNSFEILKITLSNWNYEQVEHNFIYDSDAWINNMDFLSKFSFYFISKLL